MSFNIKNTDSFQKGVLTTGGGGGGGFSSDLLPNDATNNNEYAVQNEVPLKYIVGGTDYIALGTSASTENANGSIAIYPSSVATGGSIAIGRQSTIHNGSIGIGLNTTIFSQSNSYSIVLNGTTVGLSASAGTGFFVKPIASAILSPQSLALSYDLDNYEIIKGGQISSIRYKENLEPIQGYKDLLNIESYLFKYKDSDVTDAGLIAEHIDEYPSLRKLVYYKDYNETDEDGNDVTKTKPEGVHYQKLGVFNLKLIKDLYEQDKVLTERLKNIEEKLQ